MINKVAHLADIHIKNDLTTHQEYKIQFNKLYNDLKEKAPDRIVVVGDITHDFLSCSYEVEILAVDFIINLTKIAPTIVVEGNHCIRKTDLTRTSALKNFVTTIKKANPGINLTHYDKSGFYVDENVIWVNHSHLEKTINPWINIDYEKDDTKTYIDLFHDPIKGCSNDAGYKFESTRLRNISDFKGDIGMFGDIHKFQYLNKEKTIAFPSSTIQQNFGESPDKHGYMIWDIKNKTGKLIELQTEYTKLNFYIEPGFDYDDIKFGHKLLTNLSYIKIHWHDISANINDTNETKINLHFKGLGVIESVIYEKNRIYTDISTSEILTENIDINNKSIQQSVFRDYLEMNGYDDKFINEILLIDDIVNERIENIDSINQTNWKIDKFWATNFKSYRKLEMDWEGMDGIIQIYSDENQQGKTTMLDAICYITHGTTLSTNILGGAKKEKFGDQRYINNKLDVDFCDGGIVLDINNKKMAILRKTVREWTKGKKKVKSAKTTVEYYKDGIIDDEHKITGERKEETQQMLDKLIVDFEDFIRLTLINSFNINELISMDRATFIDSIIKDAGYDIFEKKLDVFKIYKKTLNENRINIDISNSEEIIVSLKDDMINLKTNYNDIKDQINTIQKTINDLMVERDIEYRKFNQIDNKILNIDVDELNNKILKNNKTIIENNGKILIIKNKLNGLSSTYDKDRYDLLLAENQKLSDDILNLKLKISQVENSDSTLDAKLENIILKKDQIVKDKIIEHKNTIRELNSIIDDLNNDFEVAKTKEIQKHNDNIRDINYDIKTLNNELNSIKEKGKSVRKKIKELENSKTCPTCFREYDEGDEHLIHIQEKKNEYEEEISKLLKVVTEKKEKISLLNIKISNIDEQISNIELGIYSTDLIKIKEDIIKEIDSNEKTIADIEIKIMDLNSGDLSSVSDEIDQTNDYERKIKEQKEKNIELLKIGNSKLNDKKIKKENNDKELVIIKKDRDDAMMYISLVNSKTQIELENKNANLSIENIKQLIQKYKDNKIFIEQNKLINDKINEFDTIILGHEETKTDLEEQTTDMLVKGKEIKTKRDNIIEEIEVYKEQLRRDELLKTYQKCVSREGIPFYLLMKSRNLINQELSDILSSVDFNVFFDENMKLRLAMEFDAGVSINVLESSGAEKAFSAIALKLALRSINNNSRPNFLMLDEVTGNLKGKNIEHFNSMIEKMKERIGKIIIIEQNHPINFDYGIEIKKDEDGISSLKIKE